VAPHLSDTARKLLQKRIATNAYRVLLHPTGTDFYSNDYLGAARIPHRSALSPGSTGSRLISGNSEFTEKAEKHLATFFGAEAGLIFNSGYDANLGLLSSLPQRGDTVLYDSLCHASIRDGIRLGLAHSTSFEHNNPNDLAAKIKRCKGNVYVVVESIYSMEGDQCNLAEVVQICEAARAHLIVDEAHAGGLVGEKGQGLVSHLSLNNKIFAKVITYGKAFGSHGAIVLGSDELRNFLINFARSFIYTTALPPAAVDRILSITSVVSEMTAERDKLNELITYFRNHIPTGIESFNSTSPIQGIFVLGNEKSKQLAGILREQGLMVKEILSPTVPPGRERIRLCLHSFNSRDEIDQLCNQIAVWQKEFSLQA